MRHTAPPLTKHALATLANQRRDEWEQFMCGVAGFVNSRMPKDQRITKLRRGIRAIAHRGPDEAGIYDDENFSLGTVRLSVIDPLLGKQPMMTADGRFVVGFNGEIFNYLELRRELEGYGITFATKSDTEVLLYSLAFWGRAALYRLNGQFGFAFYDRERRELLLGRDPFGERPLFYTEQGGTFFFASEIKGLLAFPEVRRELSPSGVSAVGRYWTPVPGETCFTGVKSVPPGHAVRVDDSGVSVFPYYQIPVDRPYDEPLDITFDEAKATLREKLEESVRFRLRGDYPLGAFLSGGLDSAIVASIVRQNVSGELPTFSITVPDSRVDESAHQHMMAASLDTKHSSVMVTGEDVRKRFPMVVRQCEVPVHRSGPVACGILAEHVGSSGVRIVLGGDGADEAFLGYDIIKEATVLQSCLADGFSQEQERRLDAGLDDVLLTDPTRAHDILRFYRNRVANPYLVLGAHLRRFESEQLPGLVPGVRGPAENDQRLLAFARSVVDDFDKLDSVGKAQWLDYQTLLIGYGMTCHADRPGAGCGIESRYPFLDRAVAEFAARLPREWKLRGLTKEKHILREAYADVLPEEISRRPKFAMRVPGVESLLPRGTGDWVDEVLSPRRLKNSAVLDEIGVRKLVDRVQSFGEARIPFPYNHVYMQVLSILLLEDAFMHDFDVPDIDIDRILLREIDGAKGAPVN
jgi:asparagine synthase (glutamine-hydrolysing)